MTFARRNFTGAKRLTARHIFLALTGSDTAGDGTMASPFRTMAKAWATATPGDYIEIRGGAYGTLPGGGKEVWKLNQKSGAPGKPLTVRAYNSESVILDGGVRGGGANVLNAWPASMWSTPGVGIPAMLQVENGAYVTVEAITIKGSPMYGMVMDNASYSVFRDCTVEECQLGGIKVNGQHLLVERCIGTNLIMQNLNEYNATTGVGWPSGFSTIRIEPNLFSRDVTFKDCTITRVWGEGLNAFQVDGFSYTGNTVANAFSANVYIENSQNGVIDGNFIYTTADWNLAQRPPRGLAIGNEDYSSQGWTNIGVNTVRISNNIIYKCQPIMSIDISGLRAKTIAVYNNTIVDTVWDCRIESGGTMKNNIITSGMSSTASGFDDASHNCFPTGSRPWGTNVVVTDPQFAGSSRSAPSDFKLSPTSPLVGAGIIIPQVTHDFERSLRPNPPSVGAFES